MTGLLGRYGAYYFAQASFISLIFTFLPLHFHALGFTVLQITILSALPALSMIVAPRLMRTCGATRRGPRHLALPVLTFAAIAFLPLLVATSYPLALGSLLASCLATQGAAAIIEGSAIKEDINHRLHYGHARIFGSVGFILTMVLVGAVVDLAGVSSVVPVGCGTFLLLLGAAVFLRPALPTAELPDHRPELPGRAASGEAGRGLTFLAMVFLLWFSLSPNGSPLALYLRELGWSGQLMSLSWNLGVAAEIVAFMVSPAIQRRVQLNVLLRLCLVLTSLRWLLLLLSPSTAVILLSQLLHPFTFALFHLVTMKLSTVLYWRGRAVGPGALLASGPGLGMIVGSVVMGIVGDRYLTPATLNQLYALSIAAVAGAFLLSLRLRMPGSGS